MFIMFSTNVLSFESSSCFHGQNSSKKVASEKGFTVPNQEQMIFSDFYIANGWVLDELLLRVKHYHYNRVLKYSYLYLQRNVQKSTKATGPFLD